MNSSYKPKLLEIFMHEKQDSLPQLVEIRNIPQKDEAHYQQYTNKKFKKTLPIQQDDYRLDLSGYKHQRITKTKTNNTMSAIEQLELTKTQKRLTKEITELETRLKDQRRKVLIYEQKMQSLEMMIEKNNLRVKEYDKRIDQLEKENETITTCKEGLEKEIRQLRLIESSQFNSYTKVQPQQYKKEIFQKLEIYLKKLIQRFIEGLKPERISKSVEDKIQDFLGQLLQINAQSIQFTGKSKYSSKDTNIMKQKQKQIHKYSYSESPIADESSYIQSRHKIQYSPFKQSRYERELGYGMDQSHAKRIQRQRISDMMDKRQKNFSRVSNESNLPRFNFIKQSVDPSISDQSAFISISHLGRSVEKSERNDRSRSQRRKKIFE